MSSVAKDQILAMILRGHENDLEFIETLLDEQKSKIVKYPLSVFFKMQSIWTIMELLYRRDFLRVQPEQKPKLTKRETFDNIVKNKKEQMFLDHLKSKSGETDAHAQKQFLDEKLKQEIFDQDNEKPRKSGLEIIREKLERVTREIEDEEHIGDVRRFFRELKMQRKRGQVKCLEHELLKGFRKMRKLYMQGKMSSQRNRDTFLEIERIYKGCVESLDKRPSPGERATSQVAAVTGRSSN